jgi:acetamidase/formamidase
LFVGDGHAAEGDGELTGDALETSMNVEFTVDVLQGQSIDMPRAENGEYLMALGIGNSLTDALQAATTNLAQWLERDYKLNAAEVAVVLGTSMRYDIAEVVDPEVNLAAKVPKSVLSQLPR